MKKSLSLCCCILLVGLFALSCGGGGGDGGSTPSGPIVTPPAQNITGTYAMRKVSNLWSDGAYAETENVSGTMILGANTIDLFVIENGKTERGKGTYTADYDGALHTAGILHVSENDETTNWQTKNFDLTFLISGNFLTYCSGWLRYDTNTTYQECTKWEKTSDSTTIPVVGIAADEGVKSSIQKIGKFLNRKNPTDQ